MQQVNLFNTDISVSQLAFGCWGLTSDPHWGTRDEKASLATIHAALEGGITFYDTAEAYGGGNSEKLLGKALAGRRDQVIIASKMHPNSMTADEVPAALERSLDRLGTDHLDLYQIHWPDRLVSREETWSAMIKLREQGKVRAIGVCNFGVADLEEICSVERPATNQLPYNLLWRAIEHEILPRCRESETGVLAYSPLMHGLLADKYRTADDVPDGRARSRHFNTTRDLARHGEPGCESSTFAAIDAIREISSGIGPMSDVALGWVAAQPGVRCVIVGASTPRQIARNIAALDTPLSSDAIARLDVATKQLSVDLGPNPDMWQGRDNSRFR